MKRKIRLFRAAAVAAMLALLPMATAAATDYGLSVGGVNVTSDNCNNITGTYINSLDGLKPHSAVYDPATKTLTLTNVSIIRSGKNNRAIHNKKVEELKVIFVGNNRFIATDASPLRFEKYTYLSSQPEAGATEVGTTYVAGLSQDAITVVGTRAEFIGAKMNIYAYESAGIAGEKNGASACLKNSVVQWKEDPASRLNAKHRGTGIKTINYLLVENSYLYIPNYANVSTIQYTDKAFFFDGYYYTPNNKWETQDLPTTLTDKTVFANAVELNRTNFPDSVMWRKLHRYQNDTIISHILLPIAHTTDDGTSLRLSTSDLPEKVELLRDKITHLKGLELFPFITSLDVSDNELRSMALTENKLLSEIWCPGNRLNSLMPNMPDSARSFIAGLPDRSGDTAGRLYFKYKDTQTNWWEKNSLTPDEVQWAKRKGWIVLYDDGSEYTGERTTGLEGVAIEPGDADAPMLNLAGQRVGKGYRGVVIQNGRKRIVR